MTQPDGLAEGSRIADRSRLLFADGRRFLPPPSPLPLRRPDGSEWACFSFVSGQNEQTTPQCLFIDSIPIFIAVCGRIILGICLPKASIFQRARLHRDQQTRWKPHQWRPDKALTRISKRSREAPVRSPFRGPDGRIKFDGRN